MMVQNMILITTTLAVIIITILNKSLSSITSHEVWAKYT